ncbi:MAG: hypothetical protein OJF48_004505 [Afipia sp.]|jgi:hypothetical protein|nr:MAG: hypothetical protein OJF48_004505 [Afipia sp.]
MADAATSFGSFGSSIVRTSLPPGPSHILMAVSKKLLPLVIKNLSFGVRATMSTPPKWLAISRRGLPEAVLHDFITDASNEIAIEVLDAIIGTRNIPDIGETRSQPFRPT